MQVSRDPETFHSAPSINIGDIPPEIAEWLGSMINMDAPKHTKLRLIVNRGFTPRQVAKIEENVRQQAREIVDRTSTLGGECDFVSEIAAALPLQIICDMLGIPRTETKRIFELTNTILGVGDPGVRLDARRADGRGHGAVPVRPRRSRRTGSTTRRTTSPPRSCRPRSKTRTAGTSSRPASSARSSCCSSPPATRRRATRSATACSRSRSNPDQRALVDGRPRRRVRHRGRGDRALGDAGHPLPPHRDAPTRSSAARRSRPARRS